MEVGTIHGTGKQVGILGRCIQGQRFILQWRRVASFSSSLKVPFWNWRTRSDGAAMMGLFEGTFGGHRFYSHQGPHPRMFLTGYLDTIGINHDFCMIINRWPRMQQPRLSMFPNATYCSKLHFPRFKTFHDQFPSVTINIFKRGKITQGWDLVSALDWPNRYYGHDFASQDRELTFIFHKCRT